MPAHPAARRPEAEPTPCRAIALTLLLVAIPAASSLGAAPARLAAGPGSHTLSLDAAGNFVVSYAAGDAFGGFQARIELRDESGRLRWNRDLAPFSTSAATALAPDGSILAGTTVHQIDLSTPCPAAVCQILRLTPDGATTWTTPTPGATTAVVHVIDLAADAQGDVLLVTSQEGARSAAAKLDGATGDTEWRRILHTTALPRGIAPAPGGGAYVTGDWGTTRLAADGTPIWTSTRAGVDIAHEPASGDAILLTKTSLLRMRASNGGILWSQVTARSDDTRGATTTLGTNALTVVPFVLDGEALSQYGLRVGAWRLADGAFDWGFDHTSAITGGHFAVDRPSIAAGPMRFAIASDDWDSAVYSLNFTRGCADAARACAFVGLPPRVETPAPLPALPPELPDIRMDRIG